MTGQGILRRIAACLALAVAIALPVASGAQGTTKKELVARVLQLQQAEIENVALGIVERPAAQMMQEAGLAIQRQVAPEKREAMGKAIEAAVKKYIDESYPLMRERALRLAPTTLGAVLEEKMSEDDLKQLVAWLESSANKRYQQISPEMRNGFIKKLLEDARPVVDPKVQALNARIRAILGLPAAPPVVSIPGPSATPIPPSPARRTAPPANAASN